jgi:hypothetical protein
LALIRFKRLQCLNASAAVCLGQQAYAAGRSAKFTGCEIYSNLPSQADYSKIKLAGNSTQRFGAGDNRGGGDFPMKLLV